VASDDASAEHAADGGGGIDPLLSDPRWRSDNVGDTGDVEVTQPARGARRRWGRSGAVDQTSTGSITRPMPVPPPPPDLPDDDHEPPASNAGDGTVRAPTGPASSLKEDGRPPGRRGGSLPASVAPVSSVAPAAVAAAVAAPRGPVSLSGRGSPTPATGTPLSFRPTSFRSRATPSTIPLTRVGQAPAPYDASAEADGGRIADRPADRPRQARLPRRPRVRKVSRVVRSVDAWSVFKVSLVFYLAAYVVVLVAGVLLWNVAYTTGTVDNISSFFESFGWERFEFKGGEIFHNAWIIGLFFVAGLTGMNVVLATLYNLITDLVGGVRVTVLEEEVHVRPMHHGAVPGDPSGRVPTVSTTTITPKDGRRRRKHQATGTG
jgi:hypothetical protein